jgi:hypothetical protein
VQKFSPEYFELHVRYGNWNEAANVPGADPATYQPLNHCWFKDKKYVYFEGARLKHADVESFTALNELFARDRDNVYSKHGVARIHDPASFEVLDDGCVIDSAMGPRYGGYARDSRAVYFAEYMGIAPLTVRGADVHTFKSVGHFYGKDAQHVFYGGRLLAGSQPEHLELLSESYARDAASVYYFGERVKDAVAESFELLGGNCARDSKHVYDCGQIIPGADPQSFRRLDESLACDRNHVFVYNEIQPHIDSASFEHIGHDYFADKNGVYWCGKLIAEADRRSFRALGPGRAKDRKTEYRKDQPPAQRSQGRTSTAIHSLGELSGGGELVLTDSSSAFTDPEITPAPEREADMEVLARTLAAGDEAAFEIVRLAIRDPRAFVKSCQRLEPFADEPDYGWILDELDSPKSLDPLSVLIETYNKRGLLGYIDWRSDTSETINDVEPMLWRLGLRDFDWSFIHVLGEHGDGSELRNHNFLSLLRNQLRLHGLAFFNLGLFSDSYAFSVLPPSEFASINGMQCEELFQVSDHFGADEAYERGKQILQRLSTRDA